MVLNSAWLDFYETKIEYRCDEILSVYIVKNIMAALSNHYEKINNLYGVRTDKIIIEDGLREGEATTDYWRHITRIEYADLYVSDCLRGIFDSDVPNTMHIDDFERYISIVATPEELVKQNSYFQNDIRKMKGVK